MKRNLMLVVTIIIAMALMSSCSNPKDKMVGKWIIDPQSQIPDLPIEITPEYNIVIMDNEMELTDLETKDGIVTGIISVPGGFPVEIRYDSKEDNIIIEAMQNQSVYIRFEGTEEEWVQQNEYALMMQKEALVRINMYTAQVAMDKYKADNGRFPKNLDEFNKANPQNLMNPFDYEKDALFSGKEAPQYNAERLGAVYIQFDGKGDSYGIFGYGVSQLLNMDDFDLGM